MVLHAAARSGIRPGRTRRLLANDARQTLRTADFSDGDIDRLADDFIAEDRGEDTEAFIDWAHRIRRAAPSGTRSVDPG